MIIPSRRFDPERAWMLAFTNQNDGVTFSIEDTATALNGASKVSASCVFKADTLPSLDEVVLLYIINNPQQRAIGYAIALDIDKKKLQATFRSQRNDDSQVLATVDDLVTGQWHKVIARADFTAKTAELMLNGTQVASGSNLDFGQNTLTLEYGGTLANSIGFSERDSNRHLDGQICDVSVWRDDIPTFGNQRLHGREKGLAIYYPFLDKTGANLADWSNNKINGTIDATWQRGV